MTTDGWLQLLVYFLAVVAATKPLGLFTTRVYNGGRTFLHPLLRPVELLNVALDGRMPPPRQTP